MEIYFRATIDYDISRCGINSISFEYSLEEFDRNDKPVRGIYQYSSHTIPDYYSEKEAKVLCEKMIDEFNVNGYSLSSTLSEQLEVKREFVESLKGYDRFKVVNSEVECINVSIFKVNILRSKLSNVSGLLSILIRTSDEASSIKSMALSGI